MLIRELILEKTRFITCKNITYKSSVSVAHLNELIMKILDVLIGLLLASQCLSNSYPITGFKISEPTLSLIKSAVNEDALLAFSAPPSTIEWKNGGIEYGYVTRFSFSRNMNNVKENGAFQIGFIKIFLKTESELFAKLV